MFAPRSFMATVVLLAIAIQPPCIAAQCPPFIGKWGSAGSGNGMFNRPNGLAVDASGNVYVADSNNYRVQKFSAEGDYLGQWGSSGAGDGNLNYPLSVAVDAMGYVYV